MKITTVELLLVVHKIQYFFSEMCATVLNYALHTLLASLAVILLAFRFCKLTTNVI